VVDLNSDKYSEVTIENLSNAASHVRENALRNLAGKKGKGLCLLCRVLFFQVTK
jgi:hypothetical protein